MPITAAAGPLIARTLASLAIVSLTWIAPAGGSEIALDAVALDRDASVAVPGERAPALGALGLGDGRIGDGWQTTAGREPGEAAYLVAFPGPTAVGSVVLLGSWRLAYRDPRRSASDDPAVDDDGWVPVAYPGDDAHRLRVVPLPPGIETTAIRLTGPMAARDDGRFEATLRYLRTCAARLVNVAPLAVVSASSSGERDQGFRPDPRRNRPQALVDAQFGRRTWTNAGRDRDITPEDPEWVALDWGAERAISGVTVLMAEGDAGFGRVLAQRWSGDGDPVGGDGSGWATIAGIDAPKRGGQEIWPVTIDFDGGIPMRAVRLVFVAGQGSSPRAVTISQILAYEALGSRPAPDLAPPAERGVVPISFTLPQPGKATIQILDQDGAVVQNLVAGHPFASGDHTVRWDLSTLDDWSPYAHPAGHDAPPTHDLAAAGRYRWRGLWHPGLSLGYRCTFNPVKPHGVGWITADRSGGWLADHTPPQDVVRVEGSMWVGTFAEGGHALLQADGEMRKRWGSERIWLACPRVMAADGRYLYYIDQGGWVGKRMVMIQLDTRTKRSRRILVQGIEDTDEYRSSQAANLSARDSVVDIQGLAVIGDRAYIADRRNDVVLEVDLSTNLAAAHRGFAWDAVGRVFDDERMDVVREIGLESPGRIRPYGEHHLAVVSGDRVVLLDRRDGTLRELVTGLVNPLGLAVDDQLRIYVGEMDPSHQIKVFDREGALVRSFGQPGKHPVGPFDRDRLENPSGLAVDEAGRVWVAERSYQVKRTSVWDEQGRCVSQVIGPPKYGGGGDIDPRDPDRFFYEGQVFERDPASGEIDLTALIWRSDDETYPRWGSSPAYPFVNAGKLFFTTWSGPFNKVSTLTLWCYDERLERLRPVAAMGQGEDPAAPVFAWTDLDDDGAVGPRETRTGTITFGGKPWAKLGTSWQWRMNQRFEAATSSGGYDAAGVAFFRVERLTDRGYPVYALPTAFREVEGRHFSDAVFTDRAGNAISLHRPMVSVAPDGSVNWRYRNHWPGLHAGHHTTARGDEPGVVIAPTRFFGSFEANEQIGEVIAIGGNLGATYLITADGLYVDQVWKDVRRGRMLRGSEPPSDELANELTLHDEHFGGTIQRVPDGAGGSAVRYVVSPGSPHSAVYQLDGVEAIRRLDGGEFAVSDEQVARQRQLHEDRRGGPPAPRRYAVARMSGVAIDGRPEEWGQARINGFALGYDERSLYLLYHGDDERFHFDNPATADDWVEAFTKGGVLDLMLQTDAQADPQRRSAVRGDIRISFTRIGGEARAVLYDYVVPGVDQQARMAFASPWREIFIDRVAVLEGARIATGTADGRFVLEAAIPLAAIGFDPAVSPVTRGDVGFVVADESGTTAIDRVYWANPNTKIVSDVPEETRLQPDRWGTFSFE